MDFLRAFNEELRHAAKRRNERRSNEHSAQHSSTASLSTNASMIDANVISSSRNAVINSNLVSANVATEYSSVGSIRNMGMTTAGVVHVGSNAGIGTAMSPGTGISSVGAVAATVGPTPACVALAATSAPEVLPPPSSVIDPLSATGIARYASGSIRPTYNVNVQPMHVLRSCRGRSPRRISPRQVSPRVANSPRGAHSPNPKKTNEIDNILIENDAACGESGGGGSAHSGWGYAEPGHTDHQSFLVHNISDFFRAEQQRELRRSMLSELLSTQQQRIRDMNVSAGINVSNGSHRRTASQRDDNEGTMASGGMAANVGSPEFGDRQRFPSNHDRNEGHAYNSNERQHGHNSKERKHGHNSKERQPNQSCSYSKRSLYERSLQHIASNATVRNFKSVLHELSLSNSMRSEPVEKKIFKSVLQELTEPIEKKHFRNVMSELIISGSHAGINRGTASEEEEGEYSTQTEDPTVENTVENTILGTRVPSRGSSGDGNPGSSRASGIFRSRSPTTCKSGSRLSSTGGSRLSQTGGSRVSQTGGSRVSQSDTCSVQKDFEDKLIIDVQTMSGESYTFKNLRQTNTIGELKAAVLRRLDMYRKCVFPILSRGDEMFDDATLLRDAKVDRKIYEENQAKLDAGEDIEELEPVYFVSGRKFHRLYPDREIFLNNDMLRTQLDRIVGRHGELGEFLQHINSNNRTNVETNNETNTVGVYTAIGNPNGTVGAT